jgi:hypothetical protein
MISTLKTELADWRDWDVASYILSQNIGLMNTDVSLQTKAKHVFWSDNPIGNTLTEILNQLVEVGILEKRDEPDLQYRWNPEFKGSWE